MTRFSLVHFFALSFIAAVVAGCGSSTSPSSPSNSGNTGGGGGLVLVPATIDFGSATMGQPRDTIVRVFDNGIDSLTITGEGTSAVALRDTNFPRPISLIPDGFRDIHIQFTPSATVLAAVDTFHYTAKGKNYTGTLTVRAEGTASNTGSLIAVPPNLDFGTIPAQQPHDTTLTLFNNGSSAVTITSSAQSSSEINDTNFSRPVQIAPLSDIIVHVQFDPSTGGSRIAMDTIHFTSGGIKGETVVTFTATGSTAPASPSAGSTFTYTFTSVDTNGITSAPSDSTYTVVSNSLSFHGKTDVLEIQDESGGLSYYHIEGNGDVSIYVDLSSLPVPVPVTSSWFVIPLGSGIEQIDTLFDSTISYPYNGTTIPVVVTVVTDAKSLGAATVNAAGHAFLSQKGSFALSFNASAFGGFFPVANATQTATVWYSKQLGYYPERTDQAARSGVALGNTTASDSYVLKSYKLK